MCRGVFGSHVAMVLRRLRRLDRALRRQPALVPRERDGRQPGRARVAADRAGRRGDRGRERPADKLFALWNPPIVDEETGRRRSALAEASWLMGRLVADDVRTIGFTRSRRAAELSPSSRAGRSATRPAATGSSPARATSRRTGADRAQPRRRRPARGGGDERAGARDRHRLARRRRAHRVPGTRLDVAAGGPGGPARRGLARDARRAGRPPRPVPRAPSRGPVRQAGRGRRDRPREPVRPGAAPPVRRASCRSPTSTAPTSARRPPRRSSGWASEASSRGAATPGTTPAGSRRIGRSTSAPGRRRLHDRERRHRRGDRDGRRAPRLRDAPPGRRLPPHGRAVPRPGARSLAPRRRGRPGEPDHYTQARDVTDIEIVRSLEQALGDVGVSFGDVLVTDQVVGFVRKLVSTNEIVDEGRSTSRRSTWRRARSGSRSPPR